MHLENQSPCLRDRHSLVKDGLEDMPVDDTVEPLQGIALAGKLGEAVG